MKTGLDPQEAHFRERRPFNTPGFGVDDESAWGRLIDGSTREEAAVPTERGDWLAFYRGVRAAVETNAPPPVLARSAALGVSMLEAASEASRSGRRIDVAEYLTLKGLA